MKFLLQCKILKYSLSHNLAKQEISFPSVHLKNINTRIVISGQSGNLKEHKSRMSVLLYLNYKNMHS